MVLRVKFHIPFESLSEGVFAVFPKGIVISSYTTLTSLKNIGLG